MFEAGALEKNLDRSKVCPLLFGLEPADVAGPLVQFQASRFDVDEMRRVVQMINAELDDAALAADVLENVFQMWWPRLEADVRIELDRDGESEEGRRSERDMLEEVLALMRTLSRDAPSRPSHLELEVLRDLHHQYAATVAVADKTGADPAVVAALGTLGEHIEFLVRSIRRRSASFAEFRHRVAEGSAAYEWARKILGDPPSPA